MKNIDCIVYDEYVDDGYSGTSFNRPAFKRMIEDIESNKINMVVTKDMSRLGRDYIEFGYYIEKYFPLHNVRYIAINDGVDTKVDLYGNDIVPFKAVVNDMYAKDISKKIRSSLSTKKRQGLYLGNFAPYGYIKSSEDNHKLVIDKEASEVVKRIFHLYLSRCSLSTICEMLTSEGIPKPSVHKKLKNTGNIQNMNYWDESSIYQILKNPNYTGNLYQNRQKKINYKTKKMVRVPQSEWIIVENTHQPIIDQETYDKVQSLIVKNRNATRTKRDILLMGFMYCKECGRSIGVNLSNDKKRNYTICNHYRKHKKKGFCTSHINRYEYLEENVLNEIRNICNDYITSEFDKVLTNNKKDKILRNIENQISLTKNIIENRKSNLHNSYMDKLNGIITLDMYKEISDNLLSEIESSQKLIDKLELEKKEFDNIEYDKEYRKKITEYLTFQKPNKILLGNIIDKIIIDENKTIEIHYKIKALNKVNI